jgi:hypothetical protein
MTYIFAPERPGETPAPDFDAKGWRSRYFRTVGTVSRYRDGNQLVMIVSRRREEYERLRAELDAVPGNVNAVLAACDEAVASMQEPSATALRRTIVNALHRDALFITVEDAAGRDAQGGYRHRFRVEIVGPGADEAAASYLLHPDDPKWDVLGYSVTYIAVVDRVVEADRASLTFEAFTTVEAAAA